jgi:hypothetical protein
METPYKFVSFNHVVFRQSILDAPAPENALTVSFKAVSANDRPLRTRSGMDAKVRVVMAVTILDHNIMADLKADTVAVVVSCFTLRKRTDCNPAERRSLRSCR